MIEIGARPREARYAVSYLLMRGLYGNLHFPFRDFQIAPTPLPPLQSPSLWERRYIIKYNFLTLNFHHIKALLPDDNFNEYIGGVTWKVANTTSKGQTC
jgi:hypothetical protein